MTSLDYIEVDGKKFRIYNGFLDFDGYNLKDISKVKYIENLKNLEKLDIGGCELSEIKALDNLINLKWLNLSANNIQKIENLENLILKKSSNNLLELNKINK